MSETKGISLKSFNTFGIEVFAKNFIIVDSVDVILAWARDHKEDEFLILGQGSNILFSKDPDCFILKNEIRGLQLLEKDERHVTIKVGSGENWHEFVSWAVKKNYGGIENLALIPGSVGAAPVQNIGAYGVEASQLILELSYFDLVDQKIKCLKADQCAFGYRDSIFKKELYNKAFILDVTFKLTHKDHDFKIEYGPLKTVFTQLNPKDISIRAIYDKVIEIRESKLPDPAKLGNGGSFFKNPVVSNQIASHLKNKFPNLVSFPAGDHHSKLAAGWLIDQAGWKGKRIGDAGCHEKQALVLVNHGKASGMDILHLSTLIKQSVYAKFGVVLEEEVIVM